MDPVLQHPSTEVERSPEDMLTDLEDLNDALSRRLETAPPEVHRRYEAELVPLLESARTCVAQANIRARNVLEDAVVRFRSFLATSMAALPSATRGAPV